MKRTLAVLILAAVMIVPAAVAMAAIPATPIVVTAVSGDKTASWSPTVVPTANGQGWTYDLTDQVFLKSGDQVLGRVWGFSAAALGDPAVTLNFGLEANNDTRFIIESSTAFAPIQGVQAYATAGMTLSADLDGGAVTGNFPGGRCYEATFDNNRVFADLLPSFTAPPTQTTWVVGRFPGDSEFAIINEPVSSLKAAFDFNVTAGEGVSGSSRFEALPVPDASTLLLALAGGVPALAGYGLRRRRA